jgi:hypothetical protein
VLFRCAVQLSICSEHRAEVTAWSSSLPDHTTLFTRERLTIFTREPCDGRLSKVHI